MMIEKLRDLGYDISFERVREIAGGGLIYRSTLQPMGRLIRTARELAAGAMPELPPTTAAGEIGDLGRALHAWQRFLEKRASVMRAMHEVSGRVDREEMVEMGLEKLLEVSDADEVAVILIDQAGTVVTRMTSSQGLQEPLVLPPGSPFEALLKASVWDSALRAMPTPLRLPFPPYGPLTTPPFGGKGPRREQPVSRWCLFGRWRYTGWARR